MKKFNTDGIILTRTNFGEADRILTFITSDHGKVKAIARAVRKSKSKLAGGIELFSVSHISIAAGRGEISTLISSRLKTHFGSIVKDLDRTNTAYEFMRLINKNTEEQAEDGFFNLLASALKALDDGSDIELIKLWFSLQLLKLTGHAPNLHTDIEGAKLTDSASYDFTLERMHFTPELKEQGPYRADHIKFLRLAAAAAAPTLLQRVQGAQRFAKHTSPLTDSMLKNFLRV